MSYVLEAYPPGVYFQVSRRYRLLARVPEGMTAVEALSARDPQLAYISDERSARNFYLRVYAPTVTVTREQIREWRAAGGTSA